MTSGWWITIFIPACLGIFILWEFLQLYRRHKGNKSALTNSQYVRKQAKEGSRFYLWYILLFPLFIIAVGIWLFFHWAGLCLEWGLFCSLDKWL